MIKIILFQNLFPENLLFTLTIQHKKTKVVPSIKKGNYFLVPLLFTYCVTLLQADLHIQCLYHIYLLNHT